MNGIKLFNDLMEYADGKGASDVHLVPGRTAMLRIDGELTAAGQEDAAEWQDADLTEVTEQILSGDQLEEYRTKGALVCSYSFSKALRLRVSVYRQQGRDAMSVRLHPAGVPMPEKLLLPEEITELVKNGRGLLLVTGGRGSGVTTTVASLAAQIAATQSKVIVSVEDTTEYILPQGRGLVVQREIGADCASREVTEQILSGDQLEEYRTKGALVCSYSFSKALRLRVSVYRQQGRDAMSVRLHPAGVPMPEKLLLPEEITELVKNGRGLLLVTGGRGSGVTTTVASLAAQIAATQSKVIVSVEDTTEYILPQGRGLVVQREIGADCASREEALAMALQQDADVILLDGIGNEREAGLLFAAVRRGQFVILAEKEDSVTAALLHLVQCGGSTSGSQILLESLAQGLAGAMAQKLLRRQDEAGRVAAYEVLVADAGVRSLIAENRIQQLDTSAGAEKERGRVQMDDAIYNLYMKSCITSGTAIAGAKDPEDMRRKVRLF